MNDEVDALAWDVAGKLGRVAKWRGVTGTPHDDAVMALRAVSQVLDSCLASMDHAGYPLRAAPAPGHPAAGQPGTGDPVLLGGVSGETVVIELKTPHYPRRYHGGSAP